MQIQNFIFMDGNALYLANKEVRKVYQRVFSSFVSVGRLDRIPTKNLYST